MLNRFHSLALLLALAATAPAAAQDAKPPAAPPAWVYPQDVKVAGRRLTLHEPQVVSFDGPTAKAALRFPATLTDPLGRASLGVVDVGGIVHVDFVARLVKLDALDATRSAFPGLPEKDAAAVQAAMQEALPKNLLLRLELLTTRPAAAPAASAKIDAKPPQIVVRERPAALVQIDGEPVMLDVETFPIQYVANTASDLVHDTKNDLWYLLLDGAWAQGKSMKGPWRKADGVPTALTQIPLSHPRGHIRRFISGTAEYAKAKPPALPKELPEVIYADGPTELVLLAGDPLLTWVPGVRLLIVANTDSDLFFHPATDQYFLLIAGRWFAAKDLDGAWQGVEKLPEEFAKIPRDSIRGHVLSSVPGTPEAAEACALAALEERASLNKFANVQVLYEGKAAVTAPLEGDVKIVTNTEDDCFVVGKASYVCQRGVWYSSEDGKSNWKPCVDLPDALKKLSDGSVLHVTQCRCLGVDNETATFAIGGGYYGVFTSKGVPVYGTGTTRRGLIRTGNQGQNWYPCARTWGENRWYDPTSGIFQPRSVRPRADGTITADEWSPYTASYGRVRFYGCRYDQGGRRMFTWTDEDGGKWDLSAGRPDVWALWLSQVKLREGMKLDAFPFGDRSTESPPAEPRLAADEAGHVFRLNAKGAYETWETGAWKPAKPAPDVVAWIATLARIDARPEEWKTWRQLRAAPIPVYAVVTEKAK